MPYTGEQGLPLPIIIVINAHRVTEEDITDKHTRAAGLNAVFPGDQVASAITVSLRLCLKNRKDSLLVSAKKCNRVLNLHFVHFISPFVLYSLTSLASVIIVYDSISPIKRTVITGVGIEK